MPEIRQLLEEAARSGVWLTSGMDLGVRPRRARIRRVGEDVLDLDAENLHADRSQLHLNLTLAGSRYFFTTRPLSAKGADLRVELPRAIHRAERRDVPRQPHEERHQVELRLPTGESVVAEVTDESYEGMGLRAPLDAPLEVGANLEIHDLGGGKGIRASYGSVRHLRNHRDSIQAGLAVSRVPPGTPIPIESRDTILPGSLPQRAWRRILLAGALASSGPGLLAERTPFLRRRRASEITLLEYKNRRGERLKAIVDRTGTQQGAPVIIIPPAWGRTKETLLPLAATLIKTFEAAGESLVVVRYDERNRRGESHIDASCRSPGREALHYTFSGAVADIHATLEFLAGDRRFQPSRCLLLTVSLASIQGRKAVAEDPTGLLAGWISLVGMPDLQSSMRAVTGGIDWVYGLAQGVRFGTQELVGVLVDMDHAGPDGLRNRLGFFEDARRDMAAIEVPITWIYGQHDGWMSLDRVRALMSAGDTDNRRLLQVPTGHQLRNSREALETFQLVAEEASEILLGQRVHSVLPDLGALERRRNAERSRRPKTTVDLAAFWRRYLLGEDGTIGMELMSSTRLYARFMARQIGHLAVSEGDRILDLGAGTGDFGVHLAKSPGPRVSITAVDFVREALERARTRVGLHRERVLLRSVVADLDRAEPGVLPFDVESFEKVVASLLVGYLLDPRPLLREAWRVLVPGGRIVISAPKKDADISKLHADTVEERSPRAVLERFGPAIAANFEAHQAEFLNNAAKVLDLEEQGRFRFLDADELAALLQDAGFQDVRTDAGFGRPPQFSIASATKPH